MKTVSVYTGTRQEREAKGLEDAKAFCGRSYRNTLGVLRREAVKVRSEGARMARVYRYLSHLLRFVGIGSYWSQRAMIREALKG